MTTLSVRKRTEYSFIESVEPKGVQACWTALAPSVDSDYFYGE